MRNIARLSDNDRRELFRNTADKMGLNDAIVEKDFWVCFTLDYLFHRSPWKESITFKGGTSLSKAFHLISRFSEDIDLILDWRVLGYGKDEPYAAKYYPKIFEQKETAILTVSPERTFWEKATILHHKANRPEHLEMPQRYSRHYYDLYRMAATPVKETAFSRLDLLKKVVDFKMKFYPRAWAKYPEAVPGTLKLLPPEYRFAALEADE